MTLPTLNDNPRLVRELYLVCRANGIPVDPHVAAYAIHAAGNYEAIKSSYEDVITQAMINYLMGDLGMAKAKGEFKREMATAFVDGFETGWIDGSGGYTASATYDPEPEDLDWLATKTNAELGYIDSLFQSLKEIKNDAEPPSEDEIPAIARERAAGYLRTLDGVYGQGKLRAKKNKMLTLDGPDGNESCRTCQKYKGQRHRAKWWVGHDLVPAPGNETYECGGYRCQHQLFDDDGNVWAGSL